jgi:hypothetical protein
VEIGWPLLSTLRHYLTLFQSLARQVEGVDVTVIGPNIHFAIGDSRRASYIVSSRVLPQYFAGGGAQGIHIVVI